MLNSQKTPSGNSKDCANEDSNSSANYEHTHDDKFIQNLEKTEDSLHTVDKRSKSDEADREDKTKRKKVDDENQPASTDCTKSESDGLEEHKSFLDILNNTKEYDCPIARLAKLKSEGGFFSQVKNDESANSDPLGLSTLDASPEDEISDVHQVVLESSLSDNERLLIELKDCKLSVYRDSEWSVPVPVVTQLILNEDTSNKRLVSFQLGTGRLLLNTVMLPSMSFKKLKNKSIIFSGQTLGDNVSLVPHRLLFNDTTNRDEFHKLYSE